MKTIALVSLICCSVLIHNVNVKSDPKGEFSKENSLLKKKECLIAEECRQCTFDELKHDQVCFETSFKEKYHCVYDDNYSEEYYSESCKGKKKMNSVYVMLIICFVLLIIAWKYQKSQKESVLKNIFDRLSLFKETR